MGIKWRTKFDKLPNMTATAQTVSNHSVKVGALKGDHAWLAGIHEYGCTIKAEKAKYLTVPVCSEAAGKKASDFPDLFVYKSKKGNLMLARNEGGSLKFYYWLTESVTLPERAFLRNGHDNNIERIIKQTERALGQVLGGAMDIDTMLDMFGQQLSTAIKDYMAETQPNSPITIENKGSSTPLTGKTGALVESITWKKEG